MYQYYALPMALRIKHLRILAGLSQSDLADKARISRSQLSEIENEAKPANTRRLSAIAAALEVSVEELFETTGERPSYLKELETIMSSIDDEDRSAIMRMARAMAAQKRDDAPQ